MGEYINVTLKGCSKQGNKSCGKKRTLPGKWWLKRNIVTSNPPLRVHRRGYSQKMMAGFSDVSRLSHCPSSSHRISAKRR
jgi:hypothetical protein